MPEGRRSHNTDTTDREEERRQRRRSHAPDESPEKRAKRRSKSQSRSPEKRVHRQPVVTERVVTAKHRHGSSTENSSANTLSAGALSKLDALNEKRDAGDSSEGERQGPTKVRRERKGPKKKAALREEPRQKAVVEEKKVKRRVASGSILERASERSAVYYGSSSRRRKLCCLAVVVLILLAIILIPVGVLVIGKKGVSSGGSGGPGNSPNQLGGISSDQVPAWAKGNYYDPFTWYDTTDFNCSITDEKVGGLPVMGLSATWDDSTQANANVPALNKNFTYGSMPIRGVNIGGWLSIEPFITPSLFSSYSASDNIVDEYTLTKKLGPTQAATILEKHYATFITLQDFQAIQEAGFDHVRIPYSYWAVTTYDGDPYVRQISWRYLLRGIEYARQCGLRVNLDLHALPGSQNGWNHSGRQGAIGWLNGTDGALNAQRALDLHGQISAFFAQPRYARVIAIYGLVNEPKMVSLPLQPVLDWTTSAIAIVRKNGVNALLAMGDGFLGLPKWKGLMQNVPGLVLDAHQYVIFNTEQIAFNHQTKLAFACAGWTGQIKQSIDTSTGFGPTLCGEWSQADTDCATYLNDVNVGSRWTGTMNVGDAARNVLTPACPLKSSACSCAAANADPAAYAPAYRAWLLMNAEASMASFEAGWGWFYWTWATEDAVQWSWKLGMQAGILPAKVADRSAFNCAGTAPTLSSLPENY